MAESPSYPFEPIEYGAVREVAPGVHWLYSPLPFALNHVNLWLLEDGDGWTVVDTGYTERAREIWRAVLGGAMAARPVRRLICTHFHADHSGLAGWFESEHGVPPWMTYGEYAAAHLTWDRASESDVERWVGFYVENGLDPAAAEAMRARRAAFRSELSAFPLIFRRIWDTETLAIGGRCWRVITGAGHSPEHAALWCEALNVLISGDQVLPRITTNVSVWYTEPEGDPLRQYLASLGKFRHIPRDALVLPSHNRPFHGLHERLDYLARHHAERLERTFAACAEARLAAELVPVLFDRTLDETQTGFAMGETLAHLNHLVADGRLTRAAGTDGRYRFQQA